MLISIDKFGGVIPKIIDPALIPPEKSQVAINCRFDLGGMAPLRGNLKVADQVRTGVILSIYRYIDGNFFTWNEDVDAAPAPNANDTYGRVYYTRNGQLYVTDKNISKAGGTAYPMASYNPSPPAPTDAPTAVDTEPGAWTLQNVTLTYISTTEFSVLDNRAGQFSNGTRVQAAVTAGLIYGTIITSIVSGSGSIPDPIITTVTVQWDSGVLDAGLSAVSFVGGDPTLKETRGYVYTYINLYGSEGPPSLISNLIDVFDGDTVVVSGMDTGPDAAYGVTSKRIYRINQSSTGPTYQFVDEILVSVTDYTDEILDSALGEVLPSLEWDGPPPGIQGLIALPDGSLAGFVGNTLCRSVPYYPHAWPVRYQKYTAWPIIALGSYGTTIVVLTAGTPYLAVGNDPANVVMEEMDLGLASMSKRGSVRCGDTMVYPSPDGLVAIGPQVRQLITEQIMTRQDWQKRYDPSSISAFYWEGKYVAFYTDNTGYAAGFMFDLQTKELSDIPFYATAGYRDPGSGALFLVTDAGIVSFSVANNFTSVNYLSKRFKYKPAALSYVKVLAQTYPISIDVIFPEFKKGPITLTATVASSDPARIRPILSDSCEVRITGSSQVTAVFLASTAGEMPL